MNCEIGLDEFRGVIAVREDAADPCGGEKNIIGSFGLEERPYGRRIRQFQLGVGPGNDIPVASRREAPRNRRPCKTAMTGDEDSCIQIHSLCAPVGPVLLVAVVGIEAVLLRKLVALRLLKVFTDHFGDEFGKPHLGSPAEFFPGIAGIAQ